MYDPATIYKSGFTVYTTLDPGLQDQAEQMVRDQLAQMTDNNATDGALVAIKPPPERFWLWSGQRIFITKPFPGRSTWPPARGSQVQPSSR
jgi:membrane carboxypeptidase/penicillin-binding protein